MNIQYKMLSKFYDLLDVIYFRHPETSPRTALLNFIPDQPLKVLEVCIGTAANSIIIAENRAGAKVIGIDLSQAMLSLANEKIERRGLENIRTRIMDATRMNFEDNSFDIVLISLVLHEVDGDIRGKIINESKRVLKNTGKLIIVEWEQPRRPIQKLLFGIIKLMEPKGFIEFLNLNKDEYLETFALKVECTKSCDYTRVYAIRKE